MFHLFFFFCAVGARNIYCQLIMDSNLYLQALERQHKTYRFDLGQLQDYKESPGEANFVHAFVLCSATV